MFSSGNVPRTGAISKVPVAPGLVPEVTSDVDAAVVDGTGEPETLDAAALAIAEEARDVVTVDGNAVAYGATGTTVVVGSEAKALVDMRELDDAEQTQWTAFLIAVRKNRDAVQSWISNSQNNLSLRNSRGQGLVDVALNMGRLDAVEMLLRAGAELKLTESRRDRDAMQHMLACQHRIVHLDAVYLSYGKVIDRIRRHRLPPLKLLGLTRVFVRTALYMTRGVVIEKFGHRAAARERAWNLAQLFEDEEQSREDQSLPSDLVGYAMIHILFYTLSVQTNDLDGYASNLAADIAEVGAGIIAGENIRLLGNWAKIVASMIKQERSPVNRLPNP